jgi:hypothetical protein
VLLAPAALAGLARHAALGLVSGAKCGMPTVNTLEQLQSQARRFNCLPFMHKTRRQRPVLPCVSFVSLRRREYARASADLSHRKIGQEFKVIIDRKEGDYYIGRTQFDSPEVDPEVLIKVENHRLRIGSFHRVKVYDADDFDLYATIVK